MSTLSNMSWLKNNHHKAVLPLMLEEADFKNYEKIKQIVEQEYLESDYLGPKTYIEEHEIEILPRLVEFISSELHQDVPPVYQIFLTKYGVGGRYRKPNTVLVNIKSKYELGLMRCLAHEIIHIAVEDFIRKYEVEHWIKERLVYLLLSKCLPLYAKDDRLPVDVTALDRSFEKYFPDIEKVLANAK